MLERLMKRAAEQTERRAAARRGTIAASISFPGVTASVESDAVVLEGRAITRRLAVEPALRWRLMEEVRHER